MKKIFILPILIAPIAAHATNPVGPSAVGQGETPVVATASAPYATATAENGDTTNVVSASYVKGAYNDAIAAVNKVAERVEGVYDSVEDEIADKQDKLINDSTDNYMSTNVQGINSDLIEAMDMARPGGTGEVLGILDGVSDATGIDYDDTLISAAAAAKLMGVAADRAYINTEGVKTMMNSKRVSAVTTWGNDTATKLPLTNN